RALPPGFLAAVGAGELSFAYVTIKDRLPQILTKVIDTLHRHKNEFFEEHGEVRISFLVFLTSFISIH
uniref:Uncharacterized protein n=1 Tax=Nothoprocta perdicaria TaxID=30464 RepID=A0A8C7EHV6_NOTPE